MYFRLSYTLDQETPTYKQAPGFSSKPHLSMAKGDIANTNYITMMNHVGTHVEAPHHFLNNLKTIDSYDISHYIFEKPVVVDIPKRDSQLITAEDLRKVKQELAGKDLILVRTGFGDLRLTERKRYESLGPGFSVEAADYLQKLKGLRGLGFDFISLNSPQYEKEGYEAHRILLSREKGFFIIEDMNLSVHLKPLKKVIVAPLYIKGFDGAPCTVIAES